MSCTEIYGFDKEGNVYLQAEISNAWRGAMAIWESLEEKYLSPYIPDYIKHANWYSPEMSFNEIVARNGFKPSRLLPSFGEGSPVQEIWDLADSEKVCVTDKIVLFTTFDKVLVKKEDLSRVIEAFNAFEGETSLKEQAAVLQKMLGNENCIAVGWNQTSVSADTWGNYNYDDETDERLPYNCLTQDEHYWLFDELEGAV